MPWLVDWLLFNVLSFIEPNLLPWNKSISSELSFAKGHLLLLTLARFKLIVSSTVTFSLAIFSLCATFLLLSEERMLLLFSFLIHVYLLPWWHNFDLNWYHFLVLWYMCRNLFIILIITVHRRTKSTFHCNCLISIGVLKWDILFSILWGFLDHERMVCNSFSVSIVKIFVLKVFRNQLLLAKSKIVKSL